MIQTMKQIIAGIIAKLLLWCFKNSITVSDTFNSIRINALICELDKNGTIDIDKYNDTVYRGVTRMIQKSVERSVVDNG